MILKGILDRIAGFIRPAAPKALLPAFRNGQPAQAMRLAHEIARLAPDGAVELLAELKSGLSPNTPEFVRYQAAEALTAAVYPKYKFSEFGRLFLEDAEFLGYYGRIMDPGNWHSLDRKYTLRELLRLVDHLNGDVAECGTYKGASAYLMCEALKDGPFLVHLFDSFEGMPEPLPVDGTYWKRGALATSESSLHKTLRGFNNHRVYKGWIPERFAEVADHFFRLVHIDVDLHEPTLASLQFFYPRLLPGGILLLDDYGFKSCPGAKRAADEFFSDKPERIALLPTGQAMTVKQADHTRSLRPARLRWTPELVRRFWDGFPQTNLESYAFAKQGGLSLLIAIDHLLPRDGEVLDFGAGGGELVRMLCERGYKAAAYEPAENRVASLELSLARTPGFLGLISKGATRNFDVVLMTEVIEHVLDEELDATLNCLAELTKPGGTLIVTTPNNEDLELGTVYCPVSNLLFHRWQHVRSFTDETLADLLCRYGFEQVVTHKVGFDPVIYLPCDPLARNVNDVAIPDYMAKVRRNEKSAFGSELNLLYIGRRKQD